MKSKSAQQEKNPASFTPAITTIVVPMFLFGKKKKLENTQQPAPETEEQEKPKQKPKKPKATNVEKYEVTDGKVKLLAAKGLFKKRWVTVGEIPISEIKNIESSGNELILTWNDVAYRFVHVKKTENFGSLRDQILALQENESNTISLNEKISQRKQDLTAALIASADAVDLLFDILMKLHEKRVNWALLENDAKELGGGLNVTGQTVAPLQVDFSKIIDAVKTQLPKEVADSTFNVLKAIYQYFNALKPEEDIKESNPNFESAKAAIYVYYTLNDLVFAKVIGEKETSKEASALEDALSELAATSSFKVESDALNAVLDKATFDADGAGGIEQARSLVKEQLKFP